MTLRFILLLLLSLPLLLGLQRPGTRSLSNEDLAPPPMSEAVSPMEESSPTGWTHFTPSDNSFSVAFPTTPSVNYETETAEGFAFYLASFQSEREAVKYSVVYNELPFTCQESALPATLAGVRDGMLRHKGTKLLEETAITFAGHQGRRLLIADGPDHIAVRVVVVGNRIYIVGVAGLPDQVQTAEVAQFFSSFKLTAP